MTATIGIGSLCTPIRYVGGIGKSGAAGGYRTYDLSLTKGRGQPERRRNAGARTSPVAERSVI
jgi:hypothetical protein